MSAAGAVERILILRLSALGDLVELTRTVNVLHAHWPAARIDLLTSPLGEDLFRGSGLFDAFRVWPHRSLLHHPLESLRFVRRLRRERYDLVVDMHCKRITGYLAILAGGRRLIRNGTPPLHRTFLGKHRKPALRIDAMLRGLGEPEAAVARSMAEGFHVHLPVTRRQRTGMERRLRAAGWDGERTLVVLAPGSSPGWPSKRWPADAYHAIAEWLTGAGHQVVVAGSGGERTLARTVAGDTPGVISLAGETDLKELAALMSLARVALTNDSGPMHVAAAVGTPVVSLFGPTSATRHGPDVFYGPAHLSLEARPPCAPCYRGTCNQPTHLCMEGLGVDLVLEEMVKRIGPGPARACQKQDRL
ncbi:MAG: glycosyltransferase family 9 protein [Gammaproteobacteria bacterium]|nr:glycosyltransferase family 9 protein [Gammaproteobacteria bacterium]